jgi:beta-N-acetylhexosaminidase
LPTHADIRQLALGCLLAGFAGPVPPPWLARTLADGLGGVVLFGSNVGDGTDVASLTGKLRAAAGRDVVVALDEEGGDVTRLDALRGSSSPGAAALGALDDPASTEAVYLAIGRRLADAGVTVDLAPVADINLDARNPVIGVRSFSADPHVAARHVGAAVRGLQRCGVAACPKHFPGHGATAADSHHQLPTVTRSRAELDTNEFVPFRAAIAAGARAVMTGHLFAPALDADSPATVSRPITTGVLRNDLAFTGTIVTDALEMRALADDIGIVEGFVRSLLAGADAIETGAQDAGPLIGPIVSATERAVYEGRLPLERLADAARRTAAVASVATPALTSVSLDVPGSDLAARCLEVRGPLPILHAPLVVECRTPNGVATGELPWSLAEALAGHVADTEIMPVDGPVSSDAVASRAQGRSLVVVVRDPHRHPWQQSLLDAAVGHHDSVIVDVGWPAEALPRGVPLVRTRGIAPGLLTAAACLLSGAGVRA